MDDKVAKSLMKATTLSTAYRIGYEYLNNVGVGDHYVIYESQFQKPFKNFQQLALSDSEPINLESQLVQLSLKMIKSNVMPYLNFAKSFSEKWKNRLESEFIDVDTESVFPFNEVEKESLELLEGVEGIRGVLYNNESLSEVKNEFAALLRGCSQLGEKIENNIESILHFFKKNDKLNVSLSEQFVACDGNTDLESFIAQKQLGERVVGTLQMSKAQQFQKAVFFSDASMALLDRDEQWFAPEFRSKEYKHYGHELINQYMDYFFRKKPKYKELFQNAITDNVYQLNSVLTLANNVLSNERILKNKDENFFHLIQSKMEEREFEELNDYIDDTVHTHNIEKLAESIMSNKYSHLYNAGSFMYFSHLYEMDVSRSDLEQNIGKKMAQFKASEEFNEALKQYCDSLNEFDKGNYLRKADGVNADIIDGNEESKDYLVMRINDFEASKKLGVKIWCISSYESYFEEYTDNNCRQYFVFDFSKDANDKSSMLGMTLSGSGGVTAAHYKNDDPVSDEQLKDKWQQVILSNDAFSPSLKNSKKKPSL